MPHNKYLRSAFACLLSAFFSLSLANANASSTKEPLDNIEKSYNPNAAQRIKRLELLILEHADRPVGEKLATVNQFFNDVQWTSDLSQWGKPDYWQTPQETLTKFKGDCEDVAIAKYAALRRMGIPDEKLAIVYAMQKNRPHMVLAYYESENTDPIVLDGFGNPAAATAARRKDLRPVYGFNSSCLWLTDQDMRKLGKGRKLPASHRISNSERIQHLF